MFAHRHLLGIAPLSPKDITDILDLSDSYVGLNRQGAKH
ncbi:MAG: aspartate carbamoyltransferase catalytic subunit, partial [Pseudomonadota bacterium]